MRLCPCACIDALVVSRLCARAVHLIGLDGYLFEGSTARLLRFVLSTLRKQPPLESTERMQFLVLDMTTSSCTASNRTPADQPDTSGLPSHQRTNPTPADYPHTSGPTRHQRTTLTSADQPDTSGPPSHQRINLIPADQLVLCAH
jgi:hypothetical protein